MKKLLLFFSVILTINSYSQISFEKGYYIDNSQQKTECYIRNNDWSSNPTNFKYKLSENDEIKTIGIESVKEFGIYNIAKYTRAIVQIDISSDNINELSRNKNPEFNKVQFFLKVLVEGKANLYEGGSDKKFFYNVDNSTIEQLIHKSYKNTDDQIDVNNEFRIQLWGNLKCPHISMDVFSKLDYRKNSLINLFSEYNKCSNSDFLNYEAKQESKRNVFNLNLRPRINSASLIIESERLNYENTDFGNKMSFGFGIETEFILPFNKNKWAVIVEPTYQNFKAIKAKGYDSTISGELIAEAKYTSIEIPLGIRHYFFLNKNSKIFINASFIYELTLKSRVEFSMADRSGIFIKDFNSSNNLGFGIGYKLFDKYSIEMRYNTTRNVLANYTKWNSEYKTTSVIFGYTIF
ncbi:tRNA modification GTPase [Flavobacterium hydrophilum]|uniref:tRNA modification GTPase n=1 Tax=Flavobacterium hydrophilum TaxID=2211445 RepID=A0A2V4CAW1_9FLAO|nr:tRNA modification GTPase [Flavobacterium hydrophilum]PXY47090.1 tRNA modification GTPase [Flavobacterium hydrophilum]